MNKKKKKRSPALAAAIVAVFMLLVIVTTMAMFTSKDLITNTFEAGRLDIVLLEPNWKASNAKNIVPGDVVAKDPKIVNNDEVDAYVFLKVTIPCAQVILEYTQGENKGKAIDGTGDIDTPMYKFIVDGATPDRDSTTGFGQVFRSSWVEVQKGSNGDGTYSYIYGYKGENVSGLQALKTGEQTSALFDKFIVTNFNETKLDRTRDYSIIVEAYGIQTQYLGLNTEANDPQQVWQRVIDN